MLSIFRGFAKSWFAGVIVVLALLGFGVLGVAGLGNQGAFQGRFSSDVITAGSHRMSQDEFKTAFDNQLQALQQQQPGQTITQQDAVAGGFDARVLSEAASHLAYQEFVHRLGLRPSDKEVLQEIMQVPAFTEQGKFDRGIYLSVLAQNHLTAPVFEAQARDEIAQHQLDTGLSAGLRAPDTYAALFAAYQLESRDLSFFVLTPASVTAPPLPTDAQLQAMLNQLPERPKRPEMRVLTVVRFSAKALAGAMPVDPAALEKLYNFRKDAAATPEKRSLVEIPVKSAAAATAVAEKLRAGQDPATVAKSVGAAPVSYTDAIKGAIADPKVADAAFSMSAGQVSGPIQGALGLAVVKLEDVKAAHAPTLDEMRAQLEPQVRADAAGQKVYAQVQKYEDVHGGGANMLAAAKAADVTPQAVGPVSAQDADMSGARVQGLSAKLLAEAFKLPAGGESDLVSEGSGEYFAVHVDRILPPALLTVNDIRPQLTRNYMIGQIDKLLKAKGDELAARIRKGESFDSVAASAGAKAGHALGVTRASLEQNRAISQQIQGQIFAAKKGDVISGPTGQVQYLVGQIDASAPPATAQAAALALQRRDAFSEQLFEDLEGVMRERIKDQIKPKTNLALARQALGLSPDSLPKTGAGKPGSAPAP